METENVEIIKAMVRYGLGISIIPWQAAAADVRTRRQLFCSRIAGHALHRQTGWLYPKMSRLPRTVAEVIRVFEQIRPQLRRSRARAPLNLLSRGVGRSEYEVRDHTCTPSRLVLTSMRRVRFSGSGFVE